MQENVRNVYWMMKKSEDEEKKKRKVKHLEKDKGRQSDEEQLSQMRPQAGLPTPA